VRGTIARKGHRYYPVVDLGPDPDTGRRRRRWHSGHDTKREAESALRKVLEHIEDRSYVERSAQTVAAFLEEWAPAIRSDVRPGTAALYETMIRAYIVPRIGHVRLQQLAPHHLATLKTDLLASGGRGGRPLAGKTVQNVLRMLHRALADAVRWDRITRNPADLVSPPRAIPREMTTWTAEQLGTFLENTRTDSLAAAWAVLVTTGLRRGELLGLRWGDLTDKGLEITRALVLVDGIPTLSQPKTPRARRLVPIPTETAAALKEHRRRELRERLLLGPDYRDADLMFAEGDGSPINPERLSGAFGRLAKVAGLPRIRLHDLRHSWATAALRAGVPVKVVSEILGHSSTAITADVYQHTTPTMLEGASGTVAALIFGR
jgi:integrase